jgi:prephenate dehydrogenase
METAEQEALAATVEALVEEMDEEEGDEIMTTVTTMTKKMAMSLGTTATTDRYFLDCVDGPRALRAGRTYSHTESVLFLPS